MERKKFEKLIVKLLENRILEHESDQLFKWLEEEDHLTYFNRFVEVNHFLHEGQDFDYKKSLTTVHQRIRKRQNRRRMRGALRYAAVLTLLLGVGYLALIISRKDVVPVELQEIPAIVDNAIEIGSDKAILVLGDGTQVPLSKEEHFSDENVQSEADKLIYNRVKTNRLDLVYNYLKVPRGGQFSLQLSDGTQVWLNSETELKYPVHFRSGETREVELLYGEAYFEVSPSTKHEGDRFQVKNGEMEAEVLGTEFNIKAYPDEKEIYTILVNGKVVLKKESEKAILEPHQQAILAKEGAADFKIKTLSSLNEVLWKEGIFSFKNKSLKKMMQVLSRWYDMDVQFENKTAEKLEFSGVLMKEQSIEEIMNLISRTNTIQYEIKDKTLILK